MEVGQPLHRVRERLFIEVRVVLHQPPLDGPVAGLGKIQMGHLSTLILPPMS